MFKHPIYNHNWRNISTIYIYTRRLISNEIFSPSNKIYRELGRSKDLSAHPVHVSADLCNPHVVQTPNLKYNNNLR
jgi:hypothetical protein